MAGDPVSAMSVSATRALPPRTGLLRIWPTYKRYVKNPAIRPLLIWPLLRAPSARGRGPLLLGIGFANTCSRCPQKPPTAEEKKAEYEKKKANFFTRTFWTIVMIGGFFTALFMGHVYIIAIITAVQIISFKEVIAIASVPSRARDLQSTKSLNWYWLATTMYFLYGESVIYYFKHIVLVDKVLLPLATHHRFISFVLYVFGTYHGPLLSRWELSRFNAFFALK